MATSDRQPLLIAAETHDAMIAHCSKGSALACCGILAGTPPRASVVYPLRNAAESRARYEADARDLFRAASDMKARGLATVAIYQFRPGTAAVPSPTDLIENHYGDLPRVIVSLGAVPTVRAWRLTRRYCEELSWRLPPQEGGHPLPLEDERNDGAARPASFLGSFLALVLWWRRPITRISIRRLPAFSPVEPEPMWDPSLDQPPARGSGRAGPGAGARPEG